MDINEFVQKIDGSKPYVYAIKKTEDGRCLFLRDRLCTIYGMRPIVCRFYPFQLRNMRGNLYIFNYTGECPGTGKGPYLKKIFYEKMFRDFLKLMKEDAETRKGDSA